MINGAGASCDICAGWSPADEHDEPGRAEVEIPGNVNVGNEDTEAQRHKTATSIKNTKTIKSGQILALAEIDELVLTEYQVEDIS